MAADQAPPITVSETPPEPNDKSLERYRIVMAYFSYENAVYWQRGSLFLVASTALFGLVAKDLPLLNPAWAWERIASMLVVVVAGLFLTLLWHRSLQAGEYWIYHWHDILRRLEAGAFGDMKLLREFAPPVGAPPRVRAKRVAFMGVGLFYVLWTLLGSYCLIALGVKLC
jgi:hypothetical protein